MRHTGIVKSFNQSRGYGFVQPDDGTADVFIHVSDVERSGLPVIDEGMRISFATLPDRSGKGPKAVDIALAD